jgi:hypothetical protein
MIRVAEVRYLLEIYPGHENQAGFALGVPGIALRPGPPTAPKCCRAAGPHRTGGKDEG